MNIVIVDDDPIVAVSMKTILQTADDINVVATGNDGTEAVELYKKYRPDIILTDIQMKELSGIEATRLIREFDPEARVLLLTTFLDDEYVIDALKTGAKGYILKQNFECIIPAIRAVWSGQSVFGSEIVDRMPLLMQKKEIHIYEKFGINEKEYEIITLIAEGLSNKEIAERLFLSEGTVRNYVSTILEKLQLRDRTQIAVFYYRH